MTTDTKNSTDLAPAKPVTLRDIANRCGMNIATVSRALRDDDKRVNANTITMIKALALEMGYNPAISHSARRLASLRVGGQPVLNHVIAIDCVRDFSTQQYFFTMFHAMLDVLSTEGFGVFTCYGTGSDGLQPHPIFFRGELDGLLTFSYHLLAEVPWFQSLVRNGIDFPVVSLIHSTPECASVGADDYAGGYASAAHLLDLGHRRILHFIEAGGWVADRRLAGYRQACLDHGLAPDQVLYFCSWFQPYGQDDTARDWVWEALDQAFRQYPGITAILAPNDYVAVQLYEALQLNGMRVPDDLSLVGFDDTHVIPDDHGNNILTTVRVPLHGIGETGARLLLQIIRGETPPQRRIELPIELIPRASAQAVQ